MTSIIIVNYKTKELTKNCVHSIFNHFTHALFEIIIVDNNSEDDSVEYLKNLFPEITIIVNERNVGFGTANNIGVSAAIGEYVLLINSDTIVINNILAKFIAFYNTHIDLNLGVIGSLLLSANGDIVHSFGNFLTVLKPTFGNRKKGTVLAEIEEKNYTKVDIVVGANMFMKKTVFDSFNGFDENIFLYEEEMELQYRMQKAGYASFVICDRGIVHLEGKSSSNWFKRKCSFISLCYLVKKHVPYYLYFIWRLKGIFYALVFFKNPTTSFSEKLKYLKLSIYNKW